MPERVPRARDAVMNRYTHRALCLMALLLPACAAPATQPSARDPNPKPETAPDRGRVVKSLDACERDSDCLVGTPGNCCIQACPDEVTPWSVRAWKQREDRCAIIDCEIVERDACPPHDTPLPRPDAACVEGVCALVYR